VRSSRPYVRYLLAENHIMVVYIEGTRSRDGKLALPKTGFLQILAESLAMGVLRRDNPGAGLPGLRPRPRGERPRARRWRGGRKVSESVKGFGRIYRSINTRLGRGVREVRTSH